MDDTCVFDLEMPWQEVTRECNLPSCLAPFLPQERTGSSYFVDYSAVAIMPLHSAPHNCRTSFSSKLLTACAWVVQWSPGWSPPQQEINWAQWHTLSPGSCEAEARALTARCGKWRHSVPKGFQTVLIYRFPLGEDNCWSVQSETLSKTLVVSLFGKY